ncbi:MAG: hypothetical protein AAF810_22175 [Cyanobacteria bacterium P01_D01_bin.36]
MPSHSDLASNSRLIMGFGMIALGAVWLLQLLWPVLLLLVLAGFGIGGYWLLRSQQKDLQQQLRREDRLARKFYELLDYRQGRISSLEFAMHTRINGRAAQRYLHTQAQAFGGFFERSAHNDIVYIFNPAVIYSYAPQRPATQAEIDWTYAQQGSRAQQRHYLQSQSQQAQTQQERQFQAEQVKRSHTAWANARQLRAIHQLAHSSSPSSSEPGRKSMQGSLQPAADGTIPTVRGKAYGTNTVRTIDVTAVNE